MENRAYFRIRHLVLVRRDVYVEHPWVAQSLHKAFVKAKALICESYAQSVAFATVLPWTLAHADEAWREMGEDGWPYGYGLEPNRHMLETFLRCHQEQGLSKKRLSPEDLSARETLESFKI